MKNNVQKFGKFLSGMVMPNIGALIAFGFLAAFFIDTGWFPNEGFNSIVGPILSYLIPILIAFTGGKMVAGERGGVCGAIAVMGAIMSNPDITMLMAAMVMGPLGGLCIKIFDKFMENRMPAGFEMLINNFSVGIIGMLLAMLGYVVIGPVMSAILAVLSLGVSFLIEHALLPFVSVFLEPAKVLFLNNAINHGIFTPIATEQAMEAGKSILYMLETNPGPGLGVLLSYMLFCKDKTTRQSAPGAVIIQLLGGIHEIYFPYILMNPVIIIAPILGNMAAIAFFSITNAGLVGPASPGSIIAFLSMTPASDMWKSILGVLIATAVSLIVATPFVRRAGERSLESAQEEMKAKKAESKGAAAEIPAIAKKSGEVKKIIFACDAGMGSSAMGATKFRNRIKDARPDITVKNTSVDNIPSDCDIAVVQVTLAERAKKSAPQSEIITIGNFLTDPALDSLYEKLSSDKSANETSINAASAASVEASDDAKEKKQVIAAEGIKLGLKSVSKEEAIRAAGELMEKLGYVDHDYLEAMQERERLTTTYMGMGVAIPHGTDSAKKSVKKTGIVFLQYPDGVDFGDEKAQLVFGIAGIGDEHLDLLSQICTMLEDEDKLNKFKTTDDINWILEQLQG
jgi:PTS system mannitol-specific IIC component